MWPPFQQEQSIHTARAFQYHGWRRVENRSSEEREQANPGVRDRDKDRDSFRVRIRTRVGVRARARRARVSVKLRVKLRVRVRTDTESREERGQHSVEGRSGQWQPCRFSPKGRHCIGSQSGVENDPFWILDRQRPTGWGLSPRCVGSRKSEVGRRNVLRRNGSSCEVEQAQYTKKPMQNAYVCVGLGLRS